MALKLSDPEQYKHLIRYFTEYRIDSEMPNIPETVQALFFKYYFEFDFFANRMKSLNSTLCETINNTQATGIGILRGNITVGYNELVTVCNEWKIKVHYTNNNSQSIAVGLIDIKSQRNEEDLGVGVLFFPQYPLNCWLKIMKHKSCNWEKIGTYPKLKRIMSGDIVTVQVLFNPNHGTQFLLKSQNTILINRLVHIPSAELKLYVSLSDEFDSVEIISFFSTYYLSQTRKQEHELEDNMQI